MVMPLSDGMDIHFTSLHKILRNLYDQMTPLTDDIATFATAVAGLGALLYICYRVWQALARADAIDVFSLLRPFVIGLCIIGFRPIVVNSINGILKPLVVGTNHILKDQLLDMKELQKKKDRLEWEEAVRRKTYGVIDPNEDYDAELRALGLDVPTQSVMDTLYEVTHIFSTKYWVLQLFRWLLEILFGAAALVIDTLRTFYLVILTILGPIAFAISIYDGFQSTLTYWFSRYISVYLWLPIADLFSAMLAKIQVLSLDRRTLVPAGFGKLGLPDFPAYLDNRLFHDSDRCKLDCAVHGSRSVQQKDFGCWQYRYQRRGRSRRSRHGQCVRGTDEIITLVKHGI